MELGPYRRMDSERVWKSHGLSRPLRLRNRSDHPSNVVVDLVGAIVVRAHPGARFNACDLQPGARQGKHCDAADRAQSDHGHIDGSKLDSHKPKIIARWKDGTPFRTLAHIGRKARRLPPSRHKSCRPERAPVPWEYSLRSWGLPS